MNHIRYTTAELLAVAGLSENHYHQMIHRGQMVPSGRGQRGRAHTACDVLQAACLAHLARLGIGPARGALVWAMAAGPNLNRDAMILMAPRDEDSDLDVRVVLPGGDDGLDRDDAPAAFAALNLGLLQRNVAAKLAALPGGAA